MARDRPTGKFMVIVEGPAMDIHETLHTPEPLPQTVLSETSDPLHEKVHDMTVDIDRIDGMNLSPTKIGSSSGHSSSGGHDAGARIFDEDLEDKLVRARVFALADDGNWEDLATGVFSLENDMVRGVQYLRVISEKDPEVCLFEAAISADKPVNLQNDSVLGWKPEDGRDMALSFEYANCLTDVWHKICAFQRRPPEYEYFGGHIKIALPEIVDPTTIPVIDSSMTLYNNFNGLREPLAELVLEQGYIPQLLDQFKIASELENSDLIGPIFNIFKLLVLLNNREIFSELFSVGMAETVAWIFECDPGLTSRPDYRSFLRDESKVKVLFPLNNLSLEALIHRTIRLQYFKDVILPRYIDDEVYSSLTIMSRNFHNEIVQTFDAQPKYYEKLSGLFRSDSQELRLQVLKFFKDFIAICRSSNLRQISFFRSPIFLDFLGFIQSILADFSPSNVASNLASEMLLSLVQIETVQVQTWMKDQGPVEIEKQMLYVIIQRLHMESSAGARWNLVSILRILLDPPNPAGPAAQTIPNFEAFNDYFYTQHCLRLISPFSTIPPLFASRTKLSDVEADLFFHLCELTSSFIVLHKYKIKYLLVRDNILTGICQLMRCQLAFVKLASIRLFKTLLSIKDEFYSRIMISSHLFDEIFLVLNSCKHRNNLLRASVLDFFVSLLESRCHKLVDELVPKYRGQMQNLSDLHEVFPRLIQLYDSNYAIDDASSIVQGGDVSMSSTQENSQSMDKWGRTDYREEEYFSSDVETTELESADKSGPLLEDTTMPFASEPPSLKKELEDDEFGGVLGGNTTNGATTQETVTPLQPTKKIALFGSNLKNTLKSGFGLWKPTQSPVPSDAEETGSPSKKSKHT